MFHLPPSLLSTPDPEQYALPSEKEIAWQHCREEFSLQFLESTPTILFSCRSGDQPKIAGLFSKLEEILENSGKTIVEKTNLSYVVAVHVSEFWRSCPMKRSLFTLLLRAGRNYNLETDNFEQALYATSYLKNTITALQRFLFGFTKYISPPPSPVYSPISYRIGWFETFKNLRPDQIRDILVWPEEKQKIQPFLGINEIWV